MLTLVGNTPHSNAGGPIPPHSTTALDGDNCQPSLPMTFGPIELSPVQAILPTMTIILSPENRRESR